MMWLCQLLYTGDLKADGSIALVKGANSTVLFDTGLPMDKDFLLKGVTSCEFYCAAWNADAG